MRHLPPEQLEDEHVHQVYDTIANHFDHTRYKPWPGVRTFVSSLPPHSFILDLGCGNGRNLCINPHVIDVGSDISMPLCQIAVQRSRPIFCASALSIPIRDQTFDHVICVAVVHHFATADRRRQCLKEIARILKIGGTAFVTAWAIAQKKKKYDEADQMVPWTVDARFSEDVNDPPKLERFYHLFAQGEFRQLADGVPDLELIEETWEADNWNALFRRRDDP
jgi:ubiquinone/menaquinone biosynthesis C-methylase UbiE